jgi:TnpA family transposase
MRDVGHTLGRSNAASIYVRGMHARGHMEEPRYSDINDAELRAIEAELGHPVIRELAQWFIRNRTNREAVERMLHAENSNPFDTAKEEQIVRDINRPDAQSQTSVAKKVKKKCA